MKRIRIIGLRRRNPNDLYSASAVRIDQRIENHSPITKEHRPVNDGANETPTYSRSAKACADIKPLHLAHLYIETAKRHAADSLARLVREKKAAPWSAVHFRKMPDLVREVLELQVDAECLRVLLDEIANDRKLRSRRCLPYLHNVTHLSVRITSRLTGRGGAARLLTVRVEGVLGNNMSGIGKQEIGR